ncbi:MAG: SusD/RagB family nutrient-binding outer membrane lipoprotein, partial [Bacteroidales bacterium]|nr:SusD/RagB family nutrient-binding outer membrane lipoprotein [Bacteroidales bacterium]
MKKLFYITLSLILMLGATSCENWLDVNTNPNSPNNESATVDIRLPWIQYYYSYAYGSASVRGTA